ncbi:hypothetical protein DFH29DRAFT_448365 [Suillus ampliporus]|nr:hypothetical protein DFH29DRAFT_448365 [Suillus ampliporus]
MQTEYSAEDIAIARSLQTYTYIYTSMATFWTYDYICSLHQEWTFLLRSRWTKVKCLYIATRFVPFLIFTGNLYMNFNPNGSSVTCSGGFFVLRTCALWNNNRLVFAAMVTTFFAVIVACIGTSFASNATTPFVTSTIPGITGCLDNVGFFTPFLILFLFELGLLSLTLVRAMQCWRISSSALYVVLIKHNIFYYACGMFFSAVNVFTSRFLHYQYHAMFQEYAISKSLRASLLIYDIPNTQYTVSSLLYWRSLHCACTSIFGR